MSLLYAPNWIRCLAWTLFALLAAAMILVPLAASANPQFCNLYGDYSLTAAALARQERAGTLSREGADQIIAEIYVLPDDMPLAVRAQIEADFARLRRAAEATRMKPDPYGLLIMRRCSRTGGNLDAFIGVDS